MKEVNARDAKLIQYLNEAFGKERQLEQALTAHIGLTTRPNYRKRLEEHLRETKRHGDRVSRRIKQLGGSAETVSLPGPDAFTEAAEAGVSVAQRALAMAKGPLHTLRGTSEPEKMLKNAKTEYSEEAEEIATYTAIEELAKKVGDKETAKLAKEIRREEERMASFLQKLIPQLVGRSRDRRDPGGAPAERRADDTPADCIPPRVHQQPHDLRHLSESHDGPAHGIVEEPRDLREEPRDLVPRPHVRSARDQRPAQDLAVGVEPQPHVEPFERCLTTSSSRST